MIYLKNKADNAALGAEQSTEKKNTKAKKLFDIHKWELIVYMP